MMIDDGNVGEVHALEIVADRGMSRNSARLIKLRRTGGWRKIADVLTHGGPRP